MPLSIQKLDELLESKDLIPIRYFVLDGTCFYVVVYNRDFGEDFFMYIPSKYEFHLSPNNETSFKIKYIDLEKSDNIADEFGQAQNEVVAEAYDEIHISPDQRGNLREQLEEDYQKKISLNDITDEDIKEIKAIYRQVKRLRYSTKDIRYKTGITFKNYICAVRRDDSVDCFAIENFDRRSTRQLRIIVDLETFYEKGERIVPDMIKVRNSIYSILSQNQTRHSRRMNSILDNRDKIRKIIDIAMVKREHYDRQLTRLRKMLDAVSASEKTKFSQLRSLEKKNLSDNQLSANRLALQEELERLSLDRENIVSTLARMAEKKSNVILSIDKVTFDNTIMGDSMMKNFEILQKLI